MPISNERSRRPFLFDATDMAGGADQEKGATLAGCELGRYCLGVRISAAPVSRSGVQTRMQAGSAER
jgi:hypothetical protein